MGEESVLSIIEAENLCIQCDGECAPPQSLISLLRYHLGQTTYLGQTVNGTMSMSCDELMNLYSSSVQAKFKENLLSCVEKIRTGNLQEETNNEGMPLCPSFFPILIDVYFGVVDDNLSISSSLFPID